MSHVLESQLVENAKLLGVSVTWLKEWAKENKKILLLVGCVALPMTYYLNVFVAWVRKRRKLTKELEKLPGLSSSWLKGSLIHHPGPNEKGLEALLSWTVRFKTVFKFHWGPLKSGFQCVHPDSIKEVLKTAEPKSGMVDGIGGYTLLQDWLGLGLLTSSNPQWFRNRRLLTPAFHFDILKPYILVYNEAADILLEKLRRSSKTGDSVEIFKPVSLATLNVIMRCALSFHDDVQRKGDDHPYVNAVMSLAKITMYRFFQPIMWIHWLFYMTSTGREYRRHLKYVHKIADDIIANRKKALSEGTNNQDKRYLDFLDILLLARDEEGNGLTDLEIRQEVDTFLFEGHDTTASAVSWCLYTLACHPEHQARCRHEIDQLVADRDPPHLQWDDMNAMPFTTQCIKEAMRIHSPVPFVGRENTQPLTIEGVTIPPGAHIDINFYALHHNPYVWGEDHREFKPERFDIDNMKKMDSYAFCPFSAGPRNCIGQNFAMNEIKVAVARVLHRFDISVDPDHKVAYKPELVMRAENGIKLMFKDKA